MASYDERPHCIVKEAKIEADANLYVWVHLEPVCTAETFLVIFLLSVFRVQNALITQVSLHCFTVLHLFFNSFVLWMKRITIWSAEVPFVNGLTACSALLLSFTFHFCRSHAECEPEVPAGGRHLPEFGGKALGLAVQHEGAIEGQDEEVRATFVLPVL